jgi:hypothetical protein
MDSEELVIRQRELQDPNDRELLREIDHHRRELDRRVVKWEEIQKQREAERLAAEAVENAMKHPNIVDFQEAKAKIAAKRTAKLAKQSRFPDGPRVAWCRDSKSKKRIIGNPQNFHPQKSLIYGHF